MIILKVWEQRKLKSISNKVTLKNKEHQDFPVLTNSAQDGIVNQETFFDRKIANNTNDYYIVKPDDFVYNPRISKLAPYGPIRRNKLEITGVMSPLYYVFSLKSNTNKDYLSYYFISSTWYKFMIENGNTGARSDRFAIKDSIFQRMPIMLPIQNEQTKIGKLFNIIDKDISLQQRKLDLLKQLKKGLLQKMFADKAQVQPSLRFKPFSGNWCQNKMGDFIKEFSQKSQIEDEYPTLSSTNKGMENRNGRVDGKSNIGYKIIENGDLVLSPQNLWLGNININKIGVGIVSPSYKTFKFKNGINPDFIKPQLRTKRMLFNYENASTQGASVVRRNLDLKSFLEIKIYKPFDIKEENDISLIFNLLESLVAYHKSKLQYFTKLKKFLLQQMFI
ncbi:restriction endonuclease subunit S [Limosilactobacillus fastidiosus]|uniref:restriction endonuclease subunit S n=1 Tax=Limosilactobacillus fastidiosus TaxID=2759855 RepID=UPI0015FDC03E|nr:restriction endonuclease subunit S [Limosilactobacillus fastidiosus]